MNTTEDIEHPPITFKTDIGRDALFEFRIALVENKQNQ